MVRHAGPIKVATLHPAIVRIMHWLNPIAVMIVIGGGWEDRRFNWFGGI